MEGAHRSTAGDDAGDEALAAAFGRVRQLQAQWWGGALGVGWKPFFSKFASAAEVLPGVGWSGPRVFLHKFRTQLGNFPPHAKPLNRPLPQIAVQEVIQCALSCFTPENFIEATRTSGRNGGTNIL